jgi:hypothetical protein
MANAYADLDKYDGGRVGRGRKRVVIDMDDEGYERRSSDIAACRAVIAVNKNGGESRYGSIREAAKVWGVAPQTISNYLRGITRPPHGVRFRYAGADFVRKERRKWKGQAVIGTDVNGKETRYSSGAAAAKTVGACRSGISNCLKGKQISAAGYRWRVDNQ